VSDEPEGPEDPEDPEDTAPFTHRPYGHDRPGDNPFVSPSGPSYGAPLPPPVAGQVPYGPPPGQEPWQAAWAPVYGAPLPGSVDHKGARTALVLGIVAVTSLVLSFFCCGLTLPGLVCAPFAWYVGAKAKREIEAHPGTYGNVGAAATGMWMGLVMTVVGALVIALFAAIVITVGVTNWSLV
jgi:hypothetical protein